MRQLLRCTECGEHYLCCNETTKVQGPIIRTRCPVCKVTISRSLSAFLHSQTFLTPTPLDEARKMITLAYNIGRIVNDDGPRKKRRKKK